jgi:dihydroflavonol-4-reductase
MSKLEPNLNTNATVLVTGATGYVAGWIVHDLLKMGLNVHAAVRDPGDEEKVRHLNKLAERFPGKIRYFQSDLLKAGTYVHAMEGCEVVFHTASPFTLQVENPQANLVDPAVKGTRNVLQTVDATESVKRVVLTSSCAAIYGDNSDIRETEDGIFTEAHWNQTSSLDHKPYSYSKTMAEREAWKMAKAQDRWTLVTINPSLVLGPGIKPVTTSGSFEMMTRLADGSMKNGVPDYGFGAVDVREVAEAHVRAGLDSSVESGRIILSGHDTGLPELAAILRSKFGNEFPFPERTLPKWLAWLAGPFVDKTVTRTLIARNVGIQPRFANRKSIDELGIRYRPLEESLVEMFQQMVEAGVARKA